LKTLIRESKKLWVGIGLDEDEAFDDFLRRRDLVERCPAIFLPMFEELE